MSAQAHAAAVLALLQADAQVTTYDGAVPAQPAYPHRVLHWPPGDDVIADLEGNSTDQVYELYVTSVGATAAAVRVLVDRTRASLLDVTPTIAGRTCWPIRRVGGQVAREDLDVTIPATGSHPLYAVDIYRLASTSA